MDNIRVICRFRPPSDYERREEKKADYNTSDSEPIFLSSQTVKLSRLKVKNQPFQAVLDHVFRMSSNQKKIFEMVGKPMVQAVLEGYNSTIFAYGQTGSGKTWTMFGPDIEIKISTDTINLGLVQRSCSYLFNKLSKAADVIEWQVSASFIQIYKEHINDLLESTYRRLQIRTNFQTDTPYVQGLTIMGVSNIAELLVSLVTANKNRVVASHKLNSKSSRSHMLLMLNIEQKLRNGEIKRSKLNFGDLAGSEDIRKALGPNPDPKLRNEAIAINSALTALTTAINALSHGQRPSYRSSPLTHILQDSLGGNSKTTIIVAASPSMMNRSETIRTLRFAMTAKKIKNRARVNKELTKSQLMRRIEVLEAENAKLKSRVIKLENEMKDAGMDVVLSTELYMRSGNSSDTDGDDTVCVSPKNRMIITDVVSEESIINQQLQKQIESNDILEKRRIQLTQEIDDISSKYQSIKNELHISHECNIQLDDDKSELEKRIDVLNVNHQQILKSTTKQTQELDREIQRQRNRLQMHLNDKKDLQKQVQELNLQNEELNKQLMNKELIKQLMNNKNENTSQMIQQLNKMELSAEEEQMSPSELLMNRFATIEANDLRLTSDQRMKKTAHMMTDLSSDIGNLMEKWLPKNKVRSDRIRSKALVYQVRQLIGHFNVLVNQMKQTEDSFQNDLRLDIKRRDQEIKELKKGNRIVHQLQDDLVEKDDQLQTLRVEFEQLRIERDQLQIQTEKQQDMISDVHVQVKYLTNELERSTSLLHSSQKMNSHSIGTVELLPSLLDGNEDEDGYSYVSDDNSMHNHSKNNQTMISKEFEEKIEEYDEYSVISVSSDSDNNNNNNNSLPMTVKAEKRHLSHAASTVEYRPLSPIGIKNRSASTYRRRRKRSDWRGLLTKGSQLDCNDSSGLWWTARIVGFDNSRDRLRIRFDGWGDAYDEIVDRDSDRLAVYKSRYHHEIGGKKVIKEGMMSKQGKMFKTWRKRYFVLDESGSMTYYHKKGDKNGISSFSVLNISKTEKQSFGRHKQFGLLVHTNTRIWKFLCEDEKSISEWIHAINFVKNGVFEEIM